MYSSQAHAIVIGASMSGLLAARVLADRWDRVTVLDRDALPAIPAPRDGVPQSRHTHGLLARGREALEELLPGLTADLVGRGAVTGDIQADCRWFHDGRALRRGASGLVGLCVSRSLLESYVRERVSALPGVEIRAQSAVLDLRFDELRARVTGVSTAGGTIPADLVVDASGRTSRTPAWLEHWGFEAPEEEQVRIDVAYATRTFRRTPGDADGDMAFVYAATPGNPRAAALVAQEGDRWIASVCGYHGERPPVELAGFLDYAAGLGTPDMAEVLRACEPLDSGATYRFAANRRRRYERLTRLPAGLLVIGDALCSFDPVYGQGMTTAAVEALALREWLDEGLPERPTGGRPGFSRAASDSVGRLVGAGRPTLSFFERAARVVDVPWAIAVGGDRELPGTPGRIPVQTRLTNAYLRKFLRAAAYDDALAAAFLRVANLIERPEGLLSPRKLARVLAVDRRGRRAPRESARLSPASPG